MRVFILIATLIFMINTSNETIDFGKGLDGQDWMIVNDDVMGGLSSSKITFTKNSLLFKGVLSLENNGGFASIRSSNDNYDLSKYTSVKIRFRSTGREFAIRLADSNLYFRPNYKHRFSSSNGNWEIIELKMSNFKEYTMGQVSNQTVSNDTFKKIKRIGIILSDKQEGPFEIEIDYIKFI